MLSEAVSHCEIPIEAQGETDRSIGISNLLYEVSRLSRLTSVTGSSATRDSYNDLSPPSPQRASEQLQQIRSNWSFSHQNLSQRLEGRPERNWSSRRAFRLRDLSPDDSTLPCRLRSIMTSDNISSKHIASRHGLQYMEGDQSTSYIVFRPLVNLIKRGTSCIIQVNSKSSDSTSLTYQIGFLPSHDYNKEKTKQTQQLDEFCLRSINLADIDRHLFAFKIEKGKISSPEVISINDIIIPNNPILGFRINDSSKFEHACCGVISLWMNASPASGSWIEIARTKEPLDSRKQWIGYVRVNGEHTIKVYDDQDGIPIFIQEKSTGKAPLNFGLVPVTSLLFPYNRVDTSDKEDVIFHGSLISNSISKNIFQSTRKLLGKDYDITILIHSLLLILCY